MKVLSVNIADVRTVIWRGKEVQTGIYKEPVEYAIKLGDTDVENDHVVDRKYHGGKDKACYIYSADCYTFWRHRFPYLKMDYGMFGENVTIEGLEDSQLYIGDIYQLGTAKVQIAQPRQPCFKLGIKFSTQHIVKDFINEPYPGAYLRILENGEVKKGDSLVLLEEHPAKINLVEVFRLLYKSGTDHHSRIEEILYHDILPDELKDGLKKRLNS